MDRNDRGPLVAILLIGGAALLVAAVLGGALDRSPSGQGGWVYEYQSLIAGIGATAAAAITILHIRRQMRDFRKAADDDFGRVTVNEAEQIVGEAGAAISVFRHFMWQAIEELENGRVEEVRRLIERYENSAEFPRALRLMSVALREELSDLFRRLRQVNLEPAAAATAVRDFAQRAF